jgi:hypothetical protein
LLPDHVDVVAAGVAMTPVDEHGVSGERRASRSARNSEAGPGLAAPVCLTALEVEGVLAVGHRGRKEGAAEAVRPLKEQHVHGFPLSSLRL